MALPACGRAVIGGAVSALVIGLSAGCSKDEPGHLECSKQEEAEVSSLAQLRILQVFPASTQADGAFSGCGVDQSGDPIEPHAGRRYSSALAEAQIRSFYWAELADDGWHSASTVIPSEVAPSLAFQRGISCLVKDFRGTQLRFDIRFDPIPGASVTHSATSFAFHAYAVQVTARTDRGDEGSC
jgi:hypothetical protein